MAMTPTWSPRGDHRSWQVTEPVAPVDGGHSNAPGSPPPVARITMPPMVAYTSKVILQDDRTQQRLAMLEQKCRAQEVMLAEKDAQLQISEAGEPNSQLRMITLEQQLKAAEVMLAEKDGQIEKLTELVEVAKSSMHELGTEADRESQELQNELQAAKAELEDATCRLEEAEDVKQRLKECENMCEAFRNSPSGTDGVMMEVLTLRAEASRLVEQQEELQRQHTLSGQRLRSDLDALKNVMKDEGLDLSSFKEMDGGIDVEHLRESLQKCEEALEAEKRAKEHSQESLHQCKEVAARLMAERDTTQGQLEELTHLAGAFKKQAEGEISEHRWFRLVTQLTRQGDLEASQSLKESWCHGFRKWQSFADTLAEKINHRPTAVFAQEIATSCSKGDKALQALEEKWLSQGKQLSSFSELAMTKLQQAEESWEAQLREERRLRQLAEARCRQSGDEQDPEATPLDKGKVDDLLMSLEAERKEVARLREKLSEAEQTIGQLVVQSIEAPSAKAKKPGSLRSRTRSSLM
ncbi:unnamed protein product [Durusdinium trenchii]|uniref:Uncharacterized protein n=2 Tax=Durusdinium trenchii TaxID=1381693 RepID=A0ABP0M7K8_9DINO